MKATTWLFMRCAFVVQSDPLFPTRKGQDCIVDSVEGKATGAGSGRGSPSCPHRHVRMCTCPPRHVHVSSRGTCLLARFLLSFFLYFSLCISLSFSLVVYNVSLVYLCMFAYFCIYVFFSVSFCVSLSISQYFCFSFLSPSALVSVLAVDIRSGVTRKW